MMGTTSWLMQLGTLCLACAAIYRSPLTQRAAGAEFLLPQPFLFVICPKTQPICKKCYKFFFKNGVLPLTALL